MGTTLTIFSNNDIKLFHIVFGDFSSLVISSRDN